MQEIWRILSERSPLCPKKTSLGEAEKLLDSSDKSGQEKCCGTASANREAASTNTAQLHIKIFINEKTESAIIDSGATENFMTKKYTESKKHFI